MTSLADMSYRYWEAHRAERAAYTALIEAIKAGEEAGVPEAEMVRQTGLARLTVRKWRREAVEPRRGLFPDGAGKLGPGES